MWLPLLCLLSVPARSDLAATTKKEEICPFYYARELQSSSEVLFLPYNYMLDPKSRRALNIDLSRDILIFDEAHNVDKVCATGSLAAATATAAAALYPVAALARACGL